MFDIIIIGAGPAGLTSAIYAKRAGMNVAILETNTYGGQILSTPSIENYPAISNISGFNFATNLYNQANDLGTKFIFEKAISIKNNNQYKEVITKDNAYQAKAIILANGAINRKLNLENENNLIGRGISYCATCDGNLYKGKVVAVNGGGNTALEEAIYLSNIAKKVYLIHRRNEFRAEKSLVDEAKEKSNIEFVLESIISKLNGDDKLESIIIKNGSNEKELSIDGLFVAIGQVPANGNFKELINLDEKGYVIADEMCKTNVAGIFVAGDTRVKNLRQLVTAVSDGAVAATEAVKYIK